MPRSSRGCVRPTELPACVMSPAARFGAPLAFQIPAIKPMDHVACRYVTVPGCVIIEKTAAERWRMSRSRINDLSNLVSIPRLKHYQITGWYMTPNSDLGGLSPREYLSDKSDDERRRFGLDALIPFKVLKP
jgi:hypothetical protein